MRRRFLLAHHYGCARPPHKAKSGLCGDPGASSPPSLAQKILRFLGLFSSRTTIIFLTRTYKATFVTIYPKSIITMITLRCLKRNAKATTSTEINFYKFPKQSTSSKLTQFNKHPNIILERGSLDSVFCL